MVVLVLHIRNRWWSFWVKSTNGDTFLGGEDFDDTIVDYLISKFKKDNGIDLKTDKLASQRLKEAAEKAKIGYHLQTDRNKSSFYWIKQALSI